MVVYEADPKMIGFILLGLIALVVLGILFFLAHHFFFFRKAVKKQYRDLERKYTYLDALLVGQDSQYIHRLEIISHTNLLYVEKYNDFSRRFKEIYDGDDKFADSMLKQLKALISNRQYKNIKIVISDTKKAIVTFEENLNQLDNDLYSVIKPEEESRHRALQLKENYRRIKQLYFSNANSLELVAASFNKVFDKLDQSFADFEDKIEGGEYDEANAILPVIQQVNDALENSLKYLPNLCILTQNIVPQKIEELTNEYARIEKEGIPLFNISYSQKVAMWNAELGICKKKLINLQVNGVQEQLEQIQNEIITTREQLNNEIVDRDEFVVRCDDLYRDVVTLEKTFVKICSIIPEIRKIYVVNQVHEDEIVRLKESIDALGAAKRSLDNYVHSGTKQPYSILKDKLDALQSDYEVAYKGVNDFKTYIEGLKASSEEAYTLVFAYYYRCKQIENMLFELAVPEFSSLYTEQINNVYNLLNEIDQQVKVKPINVESIKEMVEQLKNSANSFFDDVENKCREAQLAESAIVYMNRERRKQAEVNQKLAILEQNYYKGDFVKVYHDANDLYNKAHAEESNDGFKR